MWFVGAFVMPLDGRREKSMGDIREVRYGHEDTGGWSGRLHA
jgi:hypothetical protein